MVQMCSSIEETEGSRTAPNIWHPDLARLHLRLYGCSPYCKPTQAGMYGGRNNTTEFRIRRLLALTMSICLSNSKQVVAHL